MVDEMMLSLLETRTVDGSITLWSLAVDVVGASLVTMTLNNHEEWMTPLRE
jgi:hypothetical protein